MQKNKYKEVYEHFTYAESKIKQIERLNGDGISIPSINQLRYAGQHILTSLIIDDESTKEDNIYEAIDHCKRATYDALEIGLLYYLSEINSFKEDYKYITVTDVIPDYIEKLKNVREAKSFIEINNRSSIDNSIDGMDKRYEEIAKHFNNLEGIYSDLDLSRDELSKKITTFRRNLLLTLLALLIAVSGVIVAIIALN